MGMFDKIILNIKCPFCGEASEISCQSKELDCKLNTFRKGDFVSDHLNYIICGAECRSEKCMNYSEKQRGYDGGLGRIFHIKIKLANGILSGEYEIVKKINLKE